MSEIQTKTQTNPDYGYRQVLLKFHRHGVKVNHKKIQLLMRREEVQSRAYRKTFRKYNSYKGTIGKIAKNHLNRRFMTDRSYNS
jgi:putative transposase